VDTPVILKIVILLPTPVVRGVGFEPLENGPVLSPSLSMLVKQNLPAESNKCSHFY